MAKRAMPSFICGAIAASAASARVAAGRAVADDADVMAARGLAARDIEDVPENAADRRAGDVHDLERFEIGHGQNQRSQTSMVSPGRSG